MVELLITFHDIVSLGVKVLFLLGSVFYAFQIGVSIRDQNLLKALFSNKLGFFVILCLTSMILVMFLGSEPYATNKPVPIKKQSDYSNDIPKKELEKLTKTLSSMSYVYDGKSTLFYDDSLKKWVKFAPSDNEIQQHDEITRMKQEFKSFHRGALYFLIYIWSVWISVGFIGYFSQKNDG